MLQRKNLQELFGEYIKEREYSSRLRSQTIESYKAVFNLFQMIMPEISTTEFLTPYAFNEFFKRLHTRSRKIGRNSFKTGIAGITLKTYRSKLNIFTEWLFMKGYIADNPLRNIPPPKIEDTAKKHLTEEEVKKLYAAIALRSRSQLIQSRDTCMVSLLYFTGIRRGEFLSLEVTDIDFLKNLLTIKSNTSKSKKARRIPLHPTLLYHLKEYIKERTTKKYTTPFLLVSNIGDARLTFHGLKHWVRNLGLKSGVRFHLHQFRHTFAYNLASQNVNAVKIQKLLGHSSVNMTMTYLGSIQSEELSSDIQKLTI